MTIQRELKQFIVGLYVFTAGYIIRTRMTLGQIQNLIRSFVCLCMYNFHPEVWMEKIKWFCHARQTPIMVFCVGRCVLHRKFIINIISRVILCLAFTGTFDIYVGITAHKSYTRTKVTTIKLYVDYFHIPHNAFSDSHFVDQQNLELSQFCT